MSKDWKNDRAEASMLEFDKKNMAEALEKLKIKQAADREKEWLELYDKCQKVTSSPSNTKAVIQWFIDNGYDAPKLSK